MTAADVAKPNPAADPAPPKRRVAALDQFRGYTMAGMFLVNFIGNYAAVHPVFGHHTTYCSYADTIMPGFFFAVGFSFRLSYLRRAREVGTLGATGHALWRNFKLLIVGFLTYNMPNFFELPGAFAHGEGAKFLTDMFLVDTFQALVHIAFASVWILPVVGLAAQWRWGYLAFSCLLHILNLHFFYYGFAHGYVIDGGPLGFVGWAVPTLLGTLVCDVVRTDPAPRAQWRRMGWWAAAFMIVGYAMACLNLIGASAEGHSGLGRFLVEPPFVPPTRPVDLWTMDQQIAGPSYMVFSAGWSLAVYLLFVIVSDAWGYHVAVFRTLGKNPLFGYLYHSVTGGMIAGYFLHHESPLWAVMLAFALNFTIIWATLRWLEYKEWYWRL